MSRIIKGEEAMWIATFSNNFRFIMRMKNMSCPKISDRTGINVHKLRAYRNGGARPTDEEVEIIANVLECDVAELLDETYNPWNFGVQESI